MYNPLVEDLMFQDKRDRAARLTAPRSTHDAGWSNRFWRRKGPRSAR